MKRYLLFFLAIIIGFDICWEIYYANGGRFSNILTFFEPEDQKNAAEVQDEILEIERQITINSNYTICIDPGHGLTGKSGTEKIHPGSSEKANTYSQGMVGRIISEEALNLKYSLALRDSLIKEGFNVIMTRETEECSLSESERAELGSGADFIITLHCDGTSNGSPNGISLFYPEKNYYDNPEVAATSQEIGQSVFNAVTTNTGAIRRVISSRDDIILFNYSKVPVFKIVFGSIEDADDEKNLLSDKYLQRFVKGAVEGFVRYANSHQAD